MSDFDKPLRVSRRGLLKLAGAGAVTLTAGVAALGWAEPAFAAQDNWRWCSSCAGLAYAGMSYVGDCWGSSTGLHTNTQSLDYTVKYVSDGGAGQANWRWCYHCNLMNFDNGPSNTACPTTGNPHVDTQSNYYIVEYTGHSDGVRGQDNWRWCTYCGGLFYHGATGKTDGACLGSANGGKHIAGGTDYIVRY